MKHRDGSIALGPFVMPEECQGNAQCADPFVFNAPACEKPTCREKHEESGCVRTESNEASWTKFRSTQQADEVTPRHEHESLMEFVLRWLEYREKPASAKEADDWEPESEMERRLR